MRRTPTLSAEFLRDLATLAAEYRPKGGPAFGDGFLSALRVLAEEIGASRPAAGLPADFDLNAFAAALGTWRGRTAERVSAGLAKLPEDDPALCPVSLFGTMDGGRFETSHTRTLAWLLDPGAEHGFGTALMERLLDHLDADKAGPLTVASVRAEQPVDGSDDGDGRIDVFAEGTRRGKPWVLAIEAKVYAGESEKQLDRYSEWLTPEGRDAETGGGLWTPLSFLDLAAAFRSRWQELRPAPGFHFLRFYLAGVLRDVCGWELPLDKDSNPYRVDMRLQWLLKERRDVR
jgi:hypothetical protein